AVECFGEAIKILENNKEPSLDRKRDLANIYRKKAFAHGKRSEYDRAKECFDKSIEIYESIRNFDKDIDIDFAYALNSRGYYFILYSPEEYDKAKECFDKAIRVGPNNFLYPWYNKGYLFTKIHFYTCLCNLT
ncbi:MAG: tetratricopeptide repeat protein, partial [Candidatus Nitrosopolaris sp.]